MDDYSFAWIDVKGFADELKEELNNNTIKDEWGDCPNLSKEVTDYLKQQLPKLYAMVETMRAIQKLYEGDYGEECFMKAVKNIKNTSF